jgi:hypothetical protein
LCRKYRDDRPDELWSGETHFLGTVINHSPKSFQEIPADNSLHSELLIEITEFQGKIMNEAFSSLNTCIFWKSSTTSSGNH